MMLCDRAQPGVKNFGIRMGQPWFPGDNVPGEEIHVFSIIMRCTMSQRAAAVLESLSPAVESLPIDENVY